jgi:hypothetical protein
VVWPAFVSRPLRPLLIERADTFCKKVHTSCLRRMGRLAKASGGDPTDYTTSSTARSFVPFYAQRLSTACVLNGARAIQKSLKRKADRRRSATTAA